MKPGPHAFVESEGVAGDAVWGVVYLRLIDFLFSLFKAHRRVYHSSLDLIVIKEGE